MTLKEILALKQVSRNAIAEALDINTVNVNRYYDLEKRSLHDLQKIAMALNISLSELIQLIYTKENIPYELIEIDESFSCDRQPQEYKKRGKNDNKQKDTFAEEGNSILIIRNLSNAIATSTESEKIANQNVQELLQLLKEKEKKN